MYTTFYNLRTEPFLLTPDHRFYFESSVHSQAMAYLSYGLDRREGFIVITGDIGAGKTTLVKRLCASIDPHNINAAHVVTTLVSGSELLRMVAAAFGLTGLPSDKGELLLRLQSYFEAAHNEGRRLLLVVDEAQNLQVSALEELRMLSNFQCGSFAPFQSFLIGQPQFRAVLAHPELEQLRQRIIARYHLGPMNRQECGDYVLHRLRQAGWENDPKFDPGALNAIFDATGGIPRRINTLCNRLMLFGFLDELHEFGADEVTRVANDLEEENAFDAIAAKNMGGRDPRMLSAAPANQGDLHLRVSELEQRLSNQEDIFRRAASTVHDFLNLSRSGSN
jgi:general secretion pathway protein A